MLCLVVHIHKQRNNLLSDCQDGTFEGPLGVWGPGAVVYIALLLIQPTGNTYKNEHNTTNNI